MQIVIQSLNYNPEEVGIGPYSTGVAQALAAAGHDVDILCARPYYPQWRVQTGHGHGWRTVSEEGVSITRCPIYVPATPSGARRLLHHASFAAALVPPMLARAARRRPDLILAIVPSLLATPVALTMSRITGARSWLHIQDFETDAAQATGLLKIGGAAAAIATRLERAMLQRADIISSISTAMCRRTIDKGVPANRVVELRNWADIDDIHPMSRDTALRSELGLGDRLVVLYSGNIARKQGIEILVDTATLLADRTDIVFAICGEGPNRTELEQKSIGLGNVRIAPLQPRARLPELLATADMFVLPQLADAADLVLPSKLANMLAAGRPVFATASPGTGIWDEVGDAGRCTPPGDARALADTIRAAADDPAWRQAAGMLARERAVAHWSREPLLDRFVQTAARLGAITRRDIPA